MAELNFGISRGAGRDVWSTMEILLDNQKTLNEQLREITRHFATSIMQIFAMIATLRLSAMVSAAIPIPVVGDVIAGLVGSAGSYIVGQGISSMGEQFG